MKNFPTLTTSKKNFVLKPLQKRHIPFIVELLSSPAIQKTLFRVPTKITEEKESHALERMYEEEKPKEIVYILTIANLLKETPIGYVKIKLIDWSVKSCFLSVAILDAPEYRGKGYAKAAYESFFSYLFSIGILKIYGRTYETNIPTIKLNEATGFRFIGRQKDFVIYPNQTALDALLFEKTADSLDMTYKKPHEQTLQELYRKLKPFAEKRALGNLSQEDHREAIETLRLYEQKVLPSDWLDFIKYTRTLLEEEQVLNIEVKEENNTDQNHDHTISYETIFEAVKNITKEVFPTIIVSASKEAEIISYNRYSGTIYVPTNGQLSTRNYIKKATQIAIQIIRTLNPYTLEFHLGSLLLTNTAISHEHALSMRFWNIFNEARTNEYIHKHTQDSFDISDLALAGDKKMIELLRFQYMGKPLPYTYIDALNFVSKAKASI